MLAEAVAAATTTVASGAAAAQIFGWTAGALGVSVGWPQAWRLWIGRRHAGLSLSSNVLTVLFSTAWMLYGVAASRLVLVVTGALGLTVATAVLLGHLRLGRPRLRTWLPWWALGTAAIGVLFMAGPRPLGVAASALTISGVLPQVVSLLRDRRRGIFAVSGVSVARWVLSSGCNILWICYGILMRDYIVVVNSTVIGLLGFAIIGLTVSAARQELVIEHARECAGAAA